MDTEIVIYVVVAMFFMGVLIKSGFGTALICTSIFIVLILLWRKVT